MKLIACTFFAIALAGCASEPVWNADAFPPQPTYATASASTAPIAEVAKP